MQWVILFLLLLNDFFLHIFEFHQASQQCSRSQRKIRDTFGGASLSSSRMGKYYREA